MTDWKFGSLERHSYGLIMADPPWSFKTYSPKGHGKSPQRHYDCMEIDDIKSLPVNQLASPDCCLFLWATWPMITHAMDVMAAWGFVYKTGGVWHKKTSTGKTSFGTGYRIRSACEPFLLGFRGNPKNSRSERNVIEAEVREHSRKPDSAYEWCERYLPDIRRCELFSRQKRRGWEPFGNEVDKFDPLI
jgi:N6-adenosine-specific RNA methylase IME4